MDANLHTIIEKRINRTIGNLQNNKMDAYYVKTCAEAVKLCEELCPEGQTVSCGGSATLDQSGIKALLRSGKYQFLDREAKGADPAQIMHQAFSCDTYFTSTNAVTENGELYNVDGVGNRTAAMLYGPKSVIVVAGYNKIVTDLDAARDRVRSIAAPANAVRLDRKVPCKVLGNCRDCRSDERLCCGFVVFAQQQFKGRIKVILVGEELGF